MICLGCWVEITVGGFWASLFLDKLFLRISRFVGLTITGGVSGESSFVDLLRGVPYLVIGVEGSCFLDWSGDF